MKLDELLVEYAEHYIVKPFEHGNGSESMLKVLYDYSPEQKQTRHDPSYPAEIDINSVVAPNGVDVLLKVGKEWLADAENDIMEYERDKKIDDRY